MNQPAPQIYRTIKSPYYNCTSIKRRNIFIRFNPHAHWEAQPKRTTNYCGINNARSLQRQINEIH